MEDTALNGVPVKAGELVYLCWASANLDDSTFEAAHSVDLERSDNRHIAFAAGIHRCLGSHLARNELRVAVDQFHRRIPDYWVPEGDRIEHEFAGVRQATRLPIAFSATP